VPTVTGDFAGAWQIVDAPLRRYLGSLGVAGTDVDDIAQETATRAIETGMRYDDPTELRRWAFVVARRLAVDLHRARRRTTAITPAVERDVVQEDQLLQVESRHLLRSVLAAVATLHPRDRDALATIPGQTPAERNRAKVARHRARRRLRELVGPLAVALAWSRRHSHVVAIGGAALAAALPTLVLPYVAQQDGAASSTGVTARYNPEAAARLLAPGGPARAPSKGNGAIVRSLRFGDRTRSTPTNARHSALTVNGPTGTQATVFTEDKDGGHKPLFCTHGAAVNRCIDLPPLPPEAVVVAISPR